MNFCYSLSSLMQDSHRNWVCVTNSDFLIPRSLQPDIVEPYIFQKMNSCQFNNENLKYNRFTPSGCKDIGNRNWPLSVSFFKKAT